MASLTVPISAWAQSSSPSSTLASQAGILPTSPLYGFKQFFESVELFVTVSPDAKAKLLLYLAQVRAAEAAAMLEQHQQALAAAALNQYAADVKKSEALVTNVSPKAAGALGNDLKAAATDGQTVASMAKAGAVAAPVVQSVTQAADTTLVASSLDATGSASQSVSLPQAADHKTMATSFMASVIASAAKVPVAEVENLRASGMGWGAIAQKLGLTLGQVVSAAETMLKTPGSTPSSSTSPSGTTSSSSAPSGSSTSPSGSSASPQSSGDSTSPTASSSDRASEHHAEAKHVKGTVTAVNGTTGLTVNGQAYAFASTVTVVKGDTKVTASAISPGMTVEITVDAQGLVTKVSINQPEHKDAEANVSGTVSAMTSTSVTIAGTTYPLASSVEVRYLDYHLTASAVTAGLSATVHVDSKGEVTRIRLLSYPALPPKKTITGTVSAISGTSVTIDGYTLAFASNLTVTQGDQRLTPSDLTAGEPVAVKLNDQGLVKKIKLLSPASSSSDATSSSSSSDTPPSSSSSAPPSSSSSAPPSSSSSTPPSSSTTSSSSMPASSSPDSGT